MNKLSVLIIGCGNIAGGYDETINARDSINSHAKAYSTNKNFSLEACVDIDEDLSLRFAKRWGFRNSYSNLKEAFLNGAHYDVVSICTPTLQHERDLQFLLKKFPRVVFCEKPLVADLKNARRLVKQYDQSKTLLAVNHNRRWDQSIQIFRERLISGQLGVIRSIVGYYNKGIMNNGTHMIDLLFFLLGSLDLISVGGCKNDYSQDDPTVSAFLMGPDDIPIHITTGFFSDFALFEIQFITSMGVFTLESNGVWRERFPEKSQSFPGYNILSNGVWRNREETSAFSLAVQNICNAVKFGEPILSTGYTALKSLVLCDRIRSEAFKMRKVNYG